MPTRPVRYYFGRLNVISARNDKSRLLQDGLNTHQIVSHRGLNWGFFEPGQLATETGEFMHGFLVRYRPVAQEEIAIPETREIDDRAIENMITAKARFFLHVPSHIIAYHPFGREISRAVFVNRFKELFERSVNEFFVDCEILPIDEEYGLRDAIRSLQKISRISVWLHPSNPSNRNAWKRIDERLRKLEVSSYREDYETGRDSTGLKIEDDAEINSKIAMAEDGYGIVRVSGQSDGARKDISTRDSPISALAPSDDEPPEIVLERLTETVRRLLERFDE